MSQTIIIISIFIILTSCSGKKDLSLAAKYHRNENLIERGCYSFSDGKSVDHYKQSDDYYYLGDSDELLLIANTVPEIWDYADVQDSVPPGVQEQIKDDMSEISLFNLSELLEQAYDDYRFCKEKEVHFQHHVVFIDASVTVGKDNIDCVFSVSYPRPGHFEGELVGDDLSFRFNSASGKLIQKD